MKFIKIFFFNFFLLLSSAYAIEEFNFDVTQAEISNDGSIFKGINGGTATSADGLVITADTFEYNKISAISAESREKLSNLKPETIGQASRISGVSPSDINILLVYMGR